MRGRSVVLAAGVLLLALVWPGPATTAARLSGAVTLVTAGLLLATVRQRRPTRGGSWTVIAGAWALLGVARLLGASPGSGSAQVPEAEAVFLLGVATLTVGVFRLVVDDGPAGLRESLLDAGVITLAGVLAMWLFVLADVLQTPELTGLALTVAVARPLLSLALLATLVCLLLAPRRHSRAWWLFLGSVAVLLVGQVVAASAAPPAASTGSAVLTVTGVLSPALLALVALGRDLGSVGEPVPEPQRGLGRGRLVALWLASLCSPVTFLALATTGTTIAPEDLTADIALAAGVTAVMFSLVLWRLVGAVDRLESTIVERDAATQRELTVADVAARLARAHQVDDVRDAVGGVAGLVDDAGARARLWLPGDPSDGDGEEMAPYLLQHPLHEDPDAGRIVVHSPAPIPDAVRSALRLVADDVALALERCRLAREVHRSEQRFRSLVQHAPDAITVHDADGTITYASPAMGRIVGRAEEELVGHRLQDLAPVEEALGIGAALRTLAADDGGTALLERRLHRPDGTWRWVESRLTNLLGDPSVGGIVANHRDVTERKRLERQLEHQANHDALTGLANRRQLARALRAERDDRAAAMLFIDLDRFKDVNDRLGHGVGDALLETIAARIGAGVRPEDLAARLGGDEFAVLLRDASVEQAQHVADRLLEAIREPVVVQGHELEMDASIGLAISRPEGDRVADLLHESDVAMYVAKREGRGRVSAFSPEMAEETVSRIELEAAVRRALEREQLHVVFQPLVTLSDGRTAGAEALLRWRHPTFGDVSPDEFIPIAERTGAIVPIGAWVLREACWQARALSTPTAPFPLHVNVSAVQLREEGFADEVETVLATVGLQGPQLTLEITESVLVDDHPVVRTSIDRLRRAGVRLAIDDFGTGWSSLSYLRDVPVDVLKIDRSFVEGMSRGPEDAALARAILQLSATFGLDAVAEGVETEEQRLALLARGCAYAQGYLFSRPLSPEGIEAHLRDERRRWSSGAPTSGALGPSPLVGGRGPATTAVGAQDGGEARTGASGLAAMDEGPPYPSGRSPR